MKRTKCVEKLQQSIYLDCKLYGYNMHNTKSSDLAEFFGALVVSMINKNLNRCAIKSLKDVVLLMVPLR